MTKDDKKRLKQLQDLESGKHLDRAECMELLELESKIKQEAALKYLKKQPLVDALWWFIENGDTDSVGVFFHLRERVRRHKHR